MLEHPVYGMLLISISKNAYLRTISREANKYMNESRRFQGEIGPDGTRKDPVREEYITAKTAVMSSLSPESLERAEQATKSYYEKFPNPELLQRELDLLATKRKELESKNS